MCCAEFTISHGFLRFSSVKKVTPVLAKWKAGIQLCKLAEKSSKSGLNNRFALSVQCTKLKIHNLKQSSLIRLRDGSSLVLYFVDKF